ncbi:MAG: hypothetical protein P8J42_02590 [Pseudomonadales bacterium]|nr:hypothetical protein [Pseudomonadales bacterium]
MSFKRDTDAPAAGLFIAFLVKNKLFQRRDLRQSIVYAVVFIRKVRIMTAIMAMLVVAAR